MKSGWKLSRAGAVLIAMLVIGLVLVVAGSGKIIALGGLLVVVSVLAMAPDLFNIRFGANVVSRPRERDVQAQAEQRRALAPTGDAHADAAERELLLARRGRELPPADERAAEPMKRRLTVAVLTLFCASAGAGATARRAAASPAASTSGRLGPVSLVVAGRSFRAGENVPVTVVNAGSVAILRGTCYILQRRTAGGWQTVDRTHGVFLGCAGDGGIEQGAHSRQPWELTLWDDLRPGTYRATLPYKRLSAGRVHALRGYHHTAQLVIAVGPQRITSKPRLPERRILAIAEKAANALGDPHPDLIQHCSGTRFEANRIAGGDFVYEWNWSYLIAVRGHFPGGDGARPFSVETLVIDAATGQITDSGGSNQYPRLAALGRVTTDLRR